jgi:hypothetical protein
MDPSRLPGRVNDGGDVVGGGDLLDDVGIQVAMVEVPDEQMGDIGIADPPPTGLRPGGAGPVRLDRARQDARGDLLAGDEVDDHQEVLEVQPGHREKLARSGLVAARQVGEVDDEFGHD